MSLSSSRVRFALSFLLLVAAPLFAGESPSPGKPGDDFEKRIDALCEKEAWGEAAGLYKAFLEAKDYKARIYMERKLRKGRPETLHLVLELGEFPHWSLAPRKVAECIGDAASPRAEVWLTSKKSTAARQILGWLRLRKGKLKEGLALLRVVLDEDPKDEKRLLDYADAVGVAGLPEVGTALYDEILARQKGKETEEANRRLRSRVISNLAQLPSMVPLLETALGDLAPEIRKSVLERWQGLATPDDVNRLLRMKGRTDPALLEAAGRAWSRLKDAARAAECFRGVLEATKKKPRSHRWMRVRALEALCRSLASLEDWAGIEKEVRGLSNRERGDFEENLYRFLEESAKKGNEGARLLRVKLYLEGGSRYESARSSAVAVLKNRPGCEGRRYVEDRFRRHRDLEAGWILAGVAEAEKRTDRAAVLYRQLFDASDPTDKNHATAAFRLGALAVEGDRFEEGILWYRTLAEYSHPRPHPFKWPEHHAEDLRETLSEKAVESWLEKSPESVLALLACEREEDIAEGLEKGLRGITDPKTFPALLEGARTLRSWRAWNVVADLHFRTEQWEGVVTCAREAAALEPGRIEPHVMHITGLLLHPLGAPDLAGSWKWIRRLCAGKDEALAERLERLVERVGAKGTPLYRHVLATGPDYTDTRAVAAEAMAKWGSDEDAERMRKAFAASPAWESAYALGVRANMKKDGPGERDWFVEAAKHGPPSSRARRRVLKSAFERFDTPSLEGLWRVLAGDEIYGTLSEAAVERFRQKGKDGLPRLFDFLRTVRKPGPVRFFLEAWVRAVRPENIVIPPDSPGSPPDPTVDFLRVQARKKPLGVDTVLRLLDGLHPDQAAGLARERAAQTERLRKAGWSLEPVPEKEESLAYGWRNAELCAAALSRLRSAGFHPGVEGWKTILARFDKVKTGYPRVLREVRNLATRDRDAFEQAVRDSESFLGLLLRGREKARVKDWETARECFEAARKQREDSPGANRGLFEAWIELRRPEEACRLYRAVLERPAGETLDLRKRLIGACYRRVWKSAGKKILGFICWSDRDIGAQPKAIAQFLSQSQGTQRSELEELTIPLTGPDAGPFLAAREALSWKAPCPRPRIYVHRVKTWYEADPTPGAAWAFGKVLYYAKRMEEAHPHLETAAKALQSDLDRFSLGTYLATVKLLGETLLASGKPDEALAWLQRPLKNEEISARFPRIGDRLGFVRDAAVVAAKGGVLERFAPVLMSEIDRPGLPPEALADCAETVARCGYRAAPLAAARRLRDADRPPGKIAESLLDVVDGLIHGGKSKKEVLTGLAWVLEFPLDEKKNGDVLFLRWRYLADAGEKEAAQAAGALDVHLTEHVFEDSWKRRVEDLARWHVGRGDREEAARVLRLFSGRPGSHGRSEFGAWVHAVNELELGDEIFQVLQEAEKALRGKALLEIVEQVLQGSEEAFTHCVMGLLKVIENPTTPESIRKRAEQALLRGYVSHWSPSLGEWLPRVLKLENPELRKWACQAVSLPGVHPPLMDRVLGVALNDPDAGVRKTAAWTALVGGGVFGAAALGKALKSDPEKAKALADQFSGSPVPRMVRALEKIKFKGDSDLSLLDILIRGDETQREAAVLQCADLPGADTQGFLAYHLLYPSLRLRRLSALALFLREGFDSADGLAPFPLERRWTPSSADRHTLVLAARAPDPFTRHLVLRTLAGVWDNRKYAKSEGVNRSVPYPCPPLGAFRGRDPLPEILPLFSEEEALVPAIRLLQALDSRSVHHLKILLASEHGRVRAAALLRRVEEGIPGAVTEAVEALASDDPWIASSAGTALLWAHEMKRRRCPRADRLGAFPKTDVLLDALTDAAKKHGAPYRAHLLDCARACDPAFGPPLEKRFPGSAEAGCRPGERLDGRLAFARRPVDVLLTALFLFREGLAGKARDLVEGIRKDPSKAGFLRAEGLTAFQDLLRSYEGMAGILRPRKKANRFFRGTLTGPKALFVDRCEVSRGEYLAFLKKASQPVTDEPEGRWKEGERDLPVTFVSRAEAERFASARGKRLPTPEEWFDAATVDTHLHRRKYPWGDAAASKRVNAGRVGEKPRPVAETCPDETPCGILHLFGNVREWCADSKDGGIAEGTGPVVGFSWLETAKDLELPGLFPEPLDLRSPTIGFRCVKDFPKNSEILKLFRLILG